MEFRQPVWTDQPLSVLLSQNAKSLQWSLITLAPGNIILCGMITLRTTDSLFSKFGGGGANGVIISFLMNPLDSVK